MVDLAKLLKDIDDDIDLTEILGESPEFNLRCKVAIRELVTERDALKAELNDTKTAADDFFNTGRIWEQKLVDCQKSFRELTWENNRLKAELEATRNQEPCGWQSRFITPTETWGFCSKEHYETVKAAPHEYPGYEVRAVYASPVPAQQPEAADALIERLWQNSNHGTRREDIEAAFKAGAANAQQPADGTDINVGTLTKDKIREIFIRNGFTIKEGCDDLKDYVYSAARELIAAVPEQQNTDTAQFSRDPYDLADELYLRGYSDCRLERDYDPRGGEEWQAVVDAIGSEVKR